MGTKIDAMVLDGGLDLAAPMETVKPGTLRACLNYERTTRAGYSRIDGYTRFDGRPDTAQFNNALVFVGLATSANPNFSPGEQVAFTINLTAGGFDTLTANLLYSTVLSVDPGSGNDIVLIVFSGIRRAFPDASLVDSIDAEGLTTSAFIESTVNHPGPLTGYATTQPELDAILEFTAQAVRDEVTMVPGSVTADDPDPNKHPITGVALYKNRTHAVRDMRVIPIRVLLSAGGGLLEGDVIEHASGSWSATIFRIVLHQGTWGEDPSSGYIIVYNESHLGQVFTASTFTAPRLADAPVFSRGNFLDGVNYSTRAALYATLPEGGWERQPLGREISWQQRSLDDPTTDYGVGFDTDPAVSPFVYRRESKRTIEDESGVKVTEWINATTAQDGSILIPGIAGGLEDPPVADTIGDPLFAPSNGITVPNLNGFDLSELPDICTIAGVELRVFRRNTTTGGLEAGFCDRKIQLILGSQVSENKARPDIAWTGDAFTAPVPDADTQASYGGPADTWGISASIGQWRDNDLAVKIEAGVFTAGTANTADFDAVQIRFHYIVPGKEVYIWDGTTSVQVDVINLQVTKGTQDTTLVPPDPSDGTNDQEGYMVVRIVDGGTGTDADKVAEGLRVIAAGEEIRSEPGGTGVLYGYTRSGDYPLSLAPYEDIVAEESRYAFEVANFYAVDDAEALFILSGAEHAYMFDGTYLLPIRVQLAAGTDKPRHVSYHFRHLALGYKFGAVYLSSLDVPLQFDALEDAADFTTGDRVTGLMGIGGQASAVFCESRVKTIQGVDFVSYQQTSVSDYTGAIEYTAVNMGFPMYCDFRGISTIDATDKYGDFARRPLSDAISPWLLRRLQTDEANQGQQIGVVGAIAARAKSQYRVFFKDGWFLSLGIVGEASVPMTGRLFYGSGTSDKAAIRPLALCSQTNRTGQDMMFFTCDPEGAGPLEYVFRMDAGRSFDGEDIPAYVELNPINAGSGIQEKRWDRLHVIGYAFTRADLVLTRAFNYREPTATPAYSLQLGIDRTDPVAEAIPVLGVANLDGDGRTIIIRMSSASATAGPHILQSATPVYTPGDVKK